MSDPDSYEGETADVEPAMSQVTFWYSLVVLPCAWLGSYLFEALMWPIWDSRYPSAVELWVVNTVPSAIGGIVTVGGAAIVTQYLGLSGAERHWVRRCRPFLTVAAPLVPVAGSRLPVA